MIKRIVITGEAGQGIKQIGYILAKSLARLDKEVSLNIAYGPAVRGGAIEVRLVCSDDTIEVPFFYKTDLLMKLSAKGVTMAEAREIIIEESLCVNAPESNDPLCEIGEKFPFFRISSEEFGSPVFINMIALGRLLKYLGVNLSEIELKSLLPSIFVKENLEAIKYGYTYRDHLDGIVTE